MDCFLKNSVGNSIHISFEFLKIFDLNNRNIEQQSMTTDAWETRAMTDTLNENSPSSEQRFIILFNPKWFTPKIIVIGLPVDKNVIYLVIGLPVDIFVIYLVNGLPVDIFVTLLVIR